MIRLLSDTDSMILNERDMKSMIRLMSDTDNRCERDKDSEMEFRDT